MYFFLNKNHFGDNIEENLAEDQFGFRKNRGTPEAIFCLRNIVEKSQLMISFCGTT